MFLQTLNGASVSKEMPNRQRIEKGMLEACLTVETLEYYVYKWIYDVYAKKLRRLIHSPLRKMENPTDSWKRMSCGMALPLSPSEINNIFMVQKTACKLQHYGLDVGRVQYHSPELGELISVLGRQARVDVRYDPSDIREVAVVHDSSDLPNPLIVPAKSKDVAPVGFDDVKRIKAPDEAEKAEDLGARATAAGLAKQAQELAESHGKGKVSNMKRARSAERARRKIAKTVKRSKSPALQPVAEVEAAEQPSRRMTVRRRAQRPKMDEME